MNAVTDLARVALPAADFTPSPDSTSLFGLPGEAPHERVLLVSDPAAGLQAILAVHSTARGPAFGGCRFWSYADDAAALTDALRLSHGMSLKNALADLPFGGGKAVILKPAGAFDREALFAAFGRAVASLEGRYITAEDVGTTTADMRVVQRHTGNVSGIPREDGAFGGDPSPWTALGVFVSIEAGAQRVFGCASLAGLHVAVQGLGAVGMHLASMLHAAGARLTVADVDAGRAAEAGRRFGANVVGTDAILGVSADVLAPCAMGAVLDARSIAALRVRLVAGAANNQLATPADGDRLHARGVTYLPDYLVNAGGIVSVAREFRGEGEASAVDAEVRRIGARVVELLDRVDAARGRPGATPARIAGDWARSKLVAA
ncbi:MAG TPA: Glu/Leu/Phe/Val dehydrogenase dimerization domain-containing protein [Burkholderiaceae bacterium]|nr:Glu/Leu/Phe/Val dehydrogenase dimerization domain-containing protein [Burkholderiaceae bacterium]